MCSSQGHGKKETKHRKVRHCSSAELLQSNREEVKKQRPYQKAVRSYECFRLSQYYDWNCTGSKLRCTLAQLKAVKDKEVQHTWQNKRLCTCRLVRQKMLLVLLFFSWVRACKRVDPKVRFLLPVHRNIFQIIFIMSLQCITLGWQKYSMKKIKAIPFFFSLQWVPNILPATERNARPKKKKKKEKNTSLLSGMSCNGFVRTHRNSQPRNSQPNCNKW